MRVAFDIRATGAQHGNGRYARCLLGALRATAGERDEVLETHRPRAADVFHAPSIEGAMLHSPCPMVVTLHDLSALRRRSERLRAGGVRLRMRHLAVQRAMQVIVPCERIAGDAIAELDLERERVTVIPAAPDPAMRRRSPAEIAAARARYELPERYLVWAGSLRRRELHKTLAELAAAPGRPPLVLLGPGASWARELPNTILTGAVEEERLAAIYSGANALLAPEDEWLGLPAIEALACGTPVVAYETPALREALAGRVTFVPRGDAAALLTAAASATRPAPTPPSWTWEDAGRATWRLYERVLTQPQRACLRGPARGRAFSKPRGATARQGSSSAGS